jgi:hypothetical protein
MLPNGVLLTSAYLPKVVEAMQSVTSRLAQRRVIDALQEHGADDFLPRARQ